MNTSWKAWKQETCCRRNHKHTRDRNPRDVKHTSFSVEHLRTQLDGHGTTAEAQLRRLQMPPRVSRRSRIPHCTAHTCDTSLLSIVWAKLIFDTLYRLDLYTVQHPHHCIDTKMFLRWLISTSQQSIPHCTAHTCDNSLLSIIWAIPLIPSIPWYVQSSIHTIVLIPKYSYADSSEQHNSFASSIYRTALPIPVITHWCP